MMILSYEYKLEPTPEQIAYIENTLDVCRSVWNFALQERKDWCKSRKSPVNACSIEHEYIMSVDEPFPKYHRQAKLLTNAKKEHEFLKSANAQVLQQTLRTLDRAWDDMKARGFGFPRFKNKYRMRSFVFPQLGKNPINNQSIKLPGLKEVKWRMSRPIPDGFVPRCARIVRKASGYFVMLSLQLNVDVPNPMPHGHPRGLDLGFDKFVATSDGEEIKRPRFLKNLQYKLKLLSRRLKNKQKGSSNRHKLNQKIARLHQRISDTRKDWHFKLAHHLCNGAGMLFVEDINFVSWQRGMFSNQSADAGFGQFVNILEWICFRRDVYFAKVNKDGTSQTCPNCGAHTGKKTLDIRSHNCNECGYTTTRDVAASQEVRNRGVSALGHSVLENVCGLDATGSIGHDILVGTGRSRKLAS
ncbi:MAG: transposase [Xenococcaceae cyanobacterium MO_167.B27]|nr:transposase [Xenococcaceae cyanobacterium MO_167.B27]